MLETTYPSKITNRYAQNRRHLKSDFPEANDFLISLQSEGRPAKERYSTDATRYPIWLSTSVNAHLYVRDKFLSYIQFRNTPHGKGLLFSPVKNGRIATIATEAPELLFPRPFRELISQNDGFESWASLERRSGKEAYLLTPCPQRSGCASFFDELLGVLRELKTEK